MDKRWIPALKVACAALFILYLTQVYRLTWLHEDAYITHRTVDNFLNGFGLRWNVAERVQTFTHPLWMLLLAGTRVLIYDYYWATVVLSWSLAFGATMVIVGVLTPSWPAAVLVMAVCALSRGWVDYATSGLENPLSMALMVLFATVLLRDDEAPPGRWRLLILSLILGFSMTNRHDSLMILGPPLAFAVWHETRLSWPKRLASVAAGLSPIVGWTIFSVIYYGFPVPNTAFAKLNSVLEFSDVAWKGALYLVHQVMFDWPGFLGLYGGLALGLWKGSAKDRWLAAGIGGHMLYMIRVGGDYNQGRFLIPAMAFAFILLGRNVVKLKPAMIAAAVVLLAGVAGTPHPRLYPGAPEWHVHLYVDGIEDAIRGYWNATRLPFVIEHGTYDINHDWAYGGKMMKARRTPLFIFGNVGFFGFFAGPVTYIIDPFALCDPLLARLPPMRKVHWRQGHLHRIIPAGYRETILSGENRLADPRLAEFYDHLTRVTRGPIWSPERWRSIWLMNTGALDHLVDHQRYFEPYRNEIPAAELPPTLDMERHWLEETVNVINRFGMRVTFDTVEHQPCMILGLGPSDYNISFWQGEQRLALERVHMGPGYSIRDHVLFVPPPVAERGYDSIFINWRMQHRGPSLGTFRWCEPPPGAGAAFPPP